MNRKTWMSALAKAPYERMEKLAAPYLPTEVELLRAPEIGAVMVQGRQGATGAPFNLGEMSVTRCSVRLSDGCVGHAYVQGRDKAKARTAAILDGLLQGEVAQTILREVVAPLVADAKTHKDARARKAAGTKVDFFTIARGED